MVKKEKPDKPFIFVFPRYSQKGETGFTLIELLIVVFISSTLLMAAVPMVTQWIEKNRLTGVVRGIVNDFHFCRQKAISSNQYYTVDFNAGLPISYDIKYGNVVGTYTTLKNITHSESSQFTSFTFSGDPVFNYRGMALQTITVTITNKNNSTKTITVSPGGKISIS